MIYTASRDYGGKSVPSSRAKSRDPLMSGTNKGKQRNIYFFTTMRHSAIHGAKREFMAKPIHDALHQFIQSVALLSSSLDKLSPSLVK